MTIKAIETVYSGYRFRSRLEARWAVFFDKLSISWQYELEGFDLGELGWYLPDFFLPQEGGWFVEVKATRLTDLEKRKGNKVDSCSPLWVMGWFPLIGVPEDPVWELAYSPYVGEVRRIGWSGNTAFLLITQGLSHTPKERIHQAVLAARQARFEHGESPGRG